MASTITPRTHEAAEIEGVAAAGADLVATVADVVEGVHLAIADRAFGWSGPAAAPAHAAHDGIANAVYGLIRGGVRTGARVGAAAAALHPAARRWAPLSGSDTGRAVIAAVNGIVGDQLVDESNPLAIELSLRVDGADIVPTAEALASAYPHPTSTLAVFVHGLCEDERGWQSRDDERGPSYPEVAAAQGATPLLVRVNTGLHISANGAALHELLDHLVVAWPVEVERITLIGHSMGGLIARSACHHGRQAGASWVPTVSDVVCLGSPHHGAPLERLAHLGAHASANVAELAPVGTLLRRRSSGIRDLGHGLLVDDDWVGLDPDARDRRHPTHVEPLDGVRYHLVASVLTEDHRHPLARLLGDGLVPASSALAESGPRALHGDDHHRHLLGRRSHFRLLHDPHIARLLSSWLAERPDR